MLEMFFNFGGHLFAWVVDDFGNYQVVDGNQTRFSVFSLTDDWR
jgi:hypothetical protein